MTFKIPLKNSDMFKLLVYLDMSKQDQIKYYIKSLLAFVSPFLACH